MQFHAEATMHETLLGNSLHWDFLSQSNVFSPSSDAHYVTVACGEGSSRPCSSWLGRLKTTQGAFTTARVLREVMSRPRLGVGRTEEADRKITPALPNWLLMKGSICSEFPPFFLKWFNQRSKRWKGNLVSGHVKSCIFNARQILANLQRRGISTIPLYVCVSETKTAGGNYIYIEKWMDVYY